MTERRVYNDAPENGIGYGPYRDTGCGEKGWPTSCFACPYPWCRWDEPKGIRKPHKKEEEP